jgi:hypothetical protein
MENPPVAQRGDEVETAVDSVVHDVPSVQATLVMQVTLKLVIDVAYDGAEATAGERAIFVCNHCCVLTMTEMKTVKWRMLHFKCIEGGLYQSWLLMASPYPGVSTTVRRSLTPRSSISTVEASI